MCLCRPWPSRTSACRMTHRAPLAASSPKRTSPATCKRRAEPSTPHGGAATANSCTSGQHSKLLQSSAGVTSPCDANTTAAHAMQPTNARAISDSLEPNAQQAGGLLAHNKGSSKPRLRLIRRRPQRPCLTQTPKPKHLHHTLKHTESMVLPSCLVHRQQRSSIWVHTANESLRLRPCTSLVQRPRHSPLRH